LSELAEGGELHEDRIRDLLDAMKAESKAIKPKNVGVIGKEHFRQRCERIGGEMKSFTYQKIEKTSDEGIPYVIEVAFANHAGHRTPMIPRGAISTNSADSLPA
jgi:hypothetical protein